MNLSRPWLSEKSSSPVMLRAVLVVAIPVIVFCLAFVAQGLKGWSNVGAAAIVELAPAFILGRWAWLRAPVLSRGTATANLVRHLAAAAAFSGLWTGLVWVAVIVLQPAASTNFQGIAIWHFLAGLAVYGMIAATSLAASFMRRFQAQQLVAARAELNALRARLNPHFLFNTLHTITALVRSDPARAEHAVEQFGGLMHYVLETDAGELVPLEDELRFVRSYLAIETLRLGDRLTVIELIEDDALDCVVPPLLLQPLVENAVRHGVDPRLGGGTVWINAALDNDVLRLQVVDDGEGCQLELMSKASGIGIAATRKQLAAWYGHAAALTMRTSPGGGFSVTISIPASWNSQERQ